MTSEWFTRAPYRAAAVVRDEPQDVGQEIFGNGKFGHLKREKAAVAHELRANRSSRRSARHQSFGAVADVNCRSNWVGKPIAQLPPGPNTIIL